MRKINESWVSKYTNKRKWIDNLRPLFQSFSDRTPGTFVEEKQTKKSCMKNKTNFINLRTYLITKI